MFVPSFVRHIELSRFEEVDRELLRITAHVRAYYGERRVIRGQTRSRCLPPSAGPTPPLTTVGVAAVEFGDESVAGHETWRALGYEPQREVRFRYSIDVLRARCDVRAAPGTRLVDVVAEGDLDLDGQYSRFSIPLIQDEHGGMIAGPRLIVRDRTE